MKKIKKLKYDINREGANMSVLLAGKMNKYECLAGDEILPN